MDLGLTDKVALVTGSYRGTGAGIARALAVEGARVLVHGLEAGQADEVASEIAEAGGRALVVTGDVRTEAGTAALVDDVRRHVDQVDIVVGMESRGFIFSAPMAYLLDAGLVPVRKLGKLPAETITVEYALEYGSNTLEIHRDAIQAGQKVLIVDDLLATGGTVKGTIELVERLKGEVVGLGFLVELDFLKGRDRLEGRRVTSVIKY